MESSKAKIFSPAIKTVILMIVVTGVAYPILVMIAGQSVLPEQSNGSLVDVDGKIIGSKLLAQEFTSPKFFHSRAASESASGVDPHITKDSALSQIQGISDATGIPINHLTTIVELDIAQNNAANWLAFSPEYANVLKLNLELVKQYPEIYSEFLNAGGK
ncbi:MAG: potassium-transporting ATPase subunit C [Candidatus Nitrosotenuis sp.]|nr:MAG: potassium-transporting ATPase subunit C [Candidatus Nitrosotenuis sp.]